MGQPKLNFLSDDRLDLLRDRKVTEGLNDLKSSVKDLDINVEVERQPAPALEPTEPRYTKESLSQMARRLYRENIKPVIDEPEAEVTRVPSTYSDRVNGKALAKALIGIRNPDNGDDGSYAPPAGPNGGNMTGPTGTYHALTTSMSLEEYEEYINKKFLSEEEEEVQEVENEPEFLQEENPAIAELEAALVEMSDTSWVAIDKVMRSIARENDITPKELHKEFKAKHGMIPDDWAEENQVTEECGWMPLEEAVVLNKVGQVFEVTYMYRCVTKRVKFFWPQVNYPTQQEMEDVVGMLYPGAKVLAYYPSTHCGDNKDNFMVLVGPSTPRAVVLKKEDWEPMTDNESLAYEMIITEEGNPISPPLIVDGGIELLIEDYDTGEERVVMINEGSLHDWFSKSKSKSGKPGWVQSDGSPCANEKGETSTPKCYSSKRLAGLKKSKEGQKKIRSADARKSRQDSGQQSKSGAAKPTMVRTFTDPKDYKKHSSGDGKTKSEEYVMEAKDNKGSGSGTKDACYHKVKSRFKVWPSAYGSGALVKCRRAGADNWGNSSKKEEFEPMDEACWKGYTKKGMKTMFGKRYPNCVKNEGYEDTKKKEVLGALNKKKGDFTKRYGKDGPDVMYAVANKIAKNKGDTSKSDDRYAYEEYIPEDMSGMSQKSGDKRSTESGAGMTAKGVAKYNRRTGGNLKTAVTTPPSKLKPGSKAANRRKSFCARSRSWNGERGKAARRRWNC